MRLFMVSLSVQLPEKFCLKNQLGVWLCHTKVCPRIAMLCWMQKSMMRDALFSETLMSVSVEPFCTSVSLGFSSFSQVTELKSLRMMPVIVLLFSEPFGRQVPTRK